MKIKAVLFDLDGTLLDTAPDFITTVNQLRREEQHAALPDEQIRRTVSNGARALVSMAFDIGFDHPEFPRLLDRLLVIYSGQLADRTAPFPGIPELLEELAKINMPWGIVTNKAQRFTQPIMAALNFNPAPATVICPDDVKNTKPDPEPLLLACRQLGCEPGEALYIGDHKRDVECGKRAGSPTIAAAYGYIDVADDPMTWEADHIVYKAEDLLDIVRAYL